MDIRKFIIPIIVFVFFSQWSLAKSNDHQSYDDEFAAYEAEFSKNTQKEIYDPFEKANRKIFSFNDFLDRNLFEPVARKYHDYTPKIILKSIHNFTNNLISIIMCRRCPNIYCIKSAFTKYNKIIHTRS